ncbi:2696_t:CDS:2 [Cetraspora pellucida]|uniref:2696_t:CDS:1 n=1 Tax=Cetraspora pellucida TaxID=1433469 RepID=A0ACA9NBM7_9GLOM|nr:2696_t:CDS:2 [Cetraspora pellucida]
MTLKVEEWAEELARRIDWGQNTFHNLLLLAPSLPAKKKIFPTQKLRKSLTAKPTSAPPANKNEEIPQEQPTNNPFSPPPAPNNSYSTKTLARVIKDDLQDALTNKSHLKNYFLVYQLFEDGDITIYTKENEKLNEELKENFNRHYQQRKEK